MAGGKQTENEVAPSEVSISVGRGVRLTESDANELADFAADACDAILAANGNSRRAKPRRNAAISRVDVVIAGDAELRRLNRDFRGKDQPTDVISFPVPHAKKGAIEGDIAISAAIAAANARRFAHPLTDELKILILHGMLHLAGYDHETDRGEMARLEADLRAQFHLPISLIGRVAESNRVAQAPTRASNPRPHKHRGAR